MFGKLANLFRRIIGWPRIYYAFGATITIRPLNEVLIECEGKSHQMTTEFIAEFENFTLINNAFHQFIIYKNNHVTTAEQFILESEGRFYDINLNPLHAELVNIDNFIIGLEKSPTYDQPRRIKYEHTSRTAFILDYEPERLLYGYINGNGLAYIDATYGKLINFGVYFTPLYVVGKVYEFGRYASILRPPTFDNCHTYMSIENNESIYKCDKTYFCLVIYKDDPTFTPQALEIMKISGNRTKPAIRAAE